jgi:hypothetical protein
MSLFHLLQLHFLHLLFLKYVVKGIRDYKEENFSEGCNDKEIGSLKSYIFLL